MVFPFSIQHKQIAHSSTYQRTIFFSNLSMCPSRPLVTRIPLICGQFLLSDWMTCNPEIDGPNQACPAIISSPTRLKSSILKFERPRLRGLVGSVRTSRYDRLILSSSQTCLSMAYLFGQFANFMLRMWLICASMTASDISTCANASVRAMIPPTD